MFGYLINPNDRTVKAVVYNGDYKEIYKLIDASTFECADICLLYTSDAADE